VAANVLQALLEKISQTEPFSHEVLNTMYHDQAAKTGIQIGDLVHPTRLAISGVSFGPGLFEMMEALGKETVIRRIRTAIEKIK
jgi:glutamyl-tRNA synthetase